MIRTICFIALFTFAAAASLSLDNQWRSFKAKYGKVYSTAEEEATRKTIFEQKLERIKAHNEQADNGLHSYRMGINNFTDMTFEEFKATHFGFRKPRNRKSALISHRYNQTTVLPESVDWRSKNIVTPVKNQGNICGSCWAFSAIASVESAQAQKTGKLVALSEQNLIDCSWDYNNLGCSGGLMDQAFNYIIANKGIDTEAAYPYTSINGTDSHICKYKKSASAATIKSYVNIPEGDENALLSAVSERVVSVALNAEEDFQNYKSGIFSSKTCLSDSDDLDHAVTLVGYGVDKGTPYWIGKNSRGETWGESGYFRIYRGQNMCGIASLALYPIV